jgi:hypothetical protein
MSVGMVVHRTLTPNLFGFNHKVLLYELLQIQVTIHTTPTIYPSQLQNVFEFFKMNTELIFSLFQLEKLCLWYCVVSKVNIVESEEEEGDPQP